MTDQITADERELIDKAIAEGKVQVVPRGMSAWRIEEGIHLAPGKSLRDRQQLAKIERRKAIRVMVRQGMSNDEIKAQFGPRSVIPFDIAYVRKTEAPPPPPPEKYTSRRSKALKAVKADRRKDRQKVRRALMRSLVADGLDARDIMRETGAAYSTVLRDLREMGLRHPQQRGPYKPKDR